MKNTQKSGFTLIELLVVMAIIAILASILFPVFGRARENARRSSCQSNLKQLGLGLLQYVQDFDEKYPYTDHVGGGWSGVIEPYTKSTLILRCPSNKITNPNSYTAVSARWGDYAGVMSSDWVLNGANTPPTTSLSLLNSPATTLALVETSTNNPFFMFDQDLPTTNCATLFAGHLGTGNNLFADGHVKALRPIALATPNVLWYRDNSSSTGIPNTGCAPTIITRAMTNFS